VSLVAVFMALATGILVGSSLLNQSLIDSQRSTIAGLAGEKDSLRHDLAGAQSEVTYRDQYLASLHATLLTGRLLGHRVQMITLPGAARKDADSLIKTLTEAGAQISGRIDVNAAFFDTANDPAGGKAALRDQTVRRLALPDVSSRGAEAQLAGALLSRVPAKTLDAAPANLLAELEHNGLITREQLSDRGDLAVLVTGTPPKVPSPGDDRVIAGSVRLAAALRAAGSGAIMVGPTAAALGGPLPAMRKDSAAAVSTVDGVDTPFGQVAAAYALVEQLAGGSGQYGAADSGDAPLPQFRVPTAKK